MLEEITIFKKLLEENKLKISLVLIASIIIGACYNYFYKPKFTAQFEMAPYFEIASDLGNELHQISNAINQQDSVYIQNKLGDGYKLNHNIIKSSNYSKNDKGSDYSFKHKNLKLSIETNDTNKQELALWNKALVDFCNNYVADSIRTYRGISVYEEKLKILSESQFLKNEKDSMFNFYKSDYQKNNIILSDAMINKIVYAQTLGEYKSAFENNYYSQLGKSIQLKQRLYSSLESFILISIVPVLLLIALIRLIKYES
mgnify:CR=1 FL=1